MLYLLILLVVAGGYWLLSVPRKPAAVTPKPGASPAPAVTPPAGQTASGQSAQPAASEPKAPPSQEPVPPAPAPVEVPVRTPTTQPAEKPKRPAPVTPPPPQPAPEAPKTEPKPPLEVLAWRFVTDQNSRFLEGTVKDNANINYQYVQAEVALYDEMGSYLGTRVVSTTTSGGWLQAGGTWKFRVLIMDARAMNCTFKLTGH